MLSFGLVSAHVDLGVAFSFTVSNPSQAGSQTQIRFFFSWVGGQSGTCEEKPFSIIFLEVCRPVPHRELMPCPFPPCLPALSILKRAPRKRPGRVAFDGITVFYFPRCQGFTSVPSRGGCTLGMAPRHSACRRFSLAEFTQEQARARREKLRLRLKEEKLEALRWKVGRPLSITRALGGLRKSKP